jgi:hypothetical protein
VISNRKHNDPARWLREGTDFGLAKLIESTAGTVSDASTRKVMTGSGVIIGTVGYMSLNRRVAKRSMLADIFNLGTVIYEMVAGRN